MEKIILLLAFLLFSCNSDKSYLKKISINTAIHKNKCYFIKVQYSDTLKFNRNINIIKNTLSDTIVFGYGILAPNYIGKFSYTKLGEKSLDLRYKNPKMNKICINQYKDKISIGDLEIELLY